MHFSTLDIENYNLIYCEPFGFGSALQVVVFKKALRVIARGYPMVMCKRIASLCLAVRYLDKVSLIINFKKMEETSDINGIF